MLIWGVEERGRPVYSFDVACFAGFDVFVGAGFLQVQLVVACACDCGCFSRDLLRGLLGLAEYGIVRRHCAGMMSLCE